MSSQDYNPDGSWKILDDWSNYIDQGSVINTDRSLAQCPAIPEEVVAGPSTSDEVITDPVAVMSEIVEPGQICFDEDTLVSPFFEGSPQSVRMQPFTSFTAAPLASSSVLLDTDSPAASSSTLSDSQTDISIRRSEEHTSELQSLAYLVCRLLLEKKKNKTICNDTTTAA